MKLKNFFLLKEAPGDPAFQSSGPAMQGPNSPAPVAQEQEQPNRWESLPEAIQNYVKDIERMCSKLARRNDNDPELKEIIHRFLLDLNKYMGEGE